MVVRSNLLASPLCVIINPPLSMTRAVVASVCLRNSPSASSITLMSASLRGGNVVIISRSVLRSVLVDELGKQRARNGVQGFENAAAIVGCRGKRGHLHLAAVEKKL